MELYKILKTFPGSQDGVKTETFEEGSECELSDYLVSCVDPEFIELIESDEEESDGDALTEEQALEADRELVDADKQPAKEVKALVIALGGEYSDKPTGLAFLEEKIAAADAG